LPPSERSLAVSVLAPPPVSHFTFLPISMPGETSIMVLLLSLWKVHRTLHQTTFFPTWSSFGFDSLVKHDIFNVEWRVVESRVSSVAWSNLETLVVSASLLSLDCLGAYCADWT
jgi:hypothetical protein